MGQLLHDREQARRLWRWSEREWFPAGPDDPHLLLLRVEALTVEEWHPAPAPLARAVGWVSAKLRRRPASLGRHRRWGAPIPS